MTTFVINRRNLLAASGSVFEPTPDPRRRAAVTPAIVRPVSASTTRRMISSPRAGSTGTSTLRRPEAPRFERARMDSSDSLPPSQPSPVNVMSIPGQAVNPTKFPSLNM